MKIKFSIKTVFCCSAFILTSLGGSWASDQLEKEIKNTEQMLGEIQLEKKQVESMVDKLMASGRINADEGAKAKRELASMNENDLDKLKTRAIAEIKEKNKMDR